jgi:hypothetical protein
MRVIACLTVGLVIALIDRGALHAEPTRALVVSLDVPEERAPEWLCVIAKDSCRDESECLVSELQELDLQPLGGERYGFEDGEPLLVHVLRRVHLLRKLPLEIDAALRALRRPVWSAADNLCSREDQNGCRPELDLRQFKTTATPSYSSRLSGRIVCGARPGAESVFDAAPGPGDHRIRRVAFIGLTFSDPVKDTAGVQQITFVGTTANVTFDRPLLQGTVTFAQVLGGDYAPSEASAIGSNERVLVRLRPRCSRFVAELPGHVDPIRAVSIRGESLDLACKAPERASRTLALEVPYTSTRAEKKLTVELGCDRRERGCKRDERADVRGALEARWTEALPPVPLKLGVRSLQFDWKRPIGCLADRWDEATPADDRTWSRSCPRATLSDSIVCEVISTEPRGEARSACKYRCEIEDKFDAPMFPIQVRFDRIREWNPGSRLRGKGTGRRTEIIYSWNDQLAFSGQTLISTVAPIDRRVMLKFDNRFEWKDSWGDQMDAIRVISGRSSDQFDLTGWGSDDPLPEWISLATPGRTCSDRVRVAVFGTRRYDEKTLEASSGRIVLERSRFRPWFRGYVVGGGGAIYENIPRPDLPDRRGIHPTLELGFGGQIDPEPLLRLAGSLSIDVEVSARLFYAGGLDALGKLDSVPYFQVEPRVGLEWWFTRRYGAAVFVGAGLGTAVLETDRQRGRSVRISLPAEVDLTIALWPRRTWLLLGLGLRYREDYAIDSDSPEFGFRTEPFATLKFRGLFGG